MWQNIINTALTMLVGLVVTLLFNGIINIPKRRKVEESKREEIRQAEEAKRAEDRLLIMKGLQALLKNDLKVRYDYWIDKEYAPEDAREDLEAEYRIYHSLGKNGVMDGRRARFLNLPIEPEETEV